MLYYTMPKSQMQVLKNKFEMRNRICKCEIKIETETSKTKLRIEIQIPNLKFKT